MTTVREDWLGTTVEEVLEPELAICDPHHHLWDRPDSRYLLDELLADTRDGGHNITETVFVECSAMYRKDGPTAMASVGEVEFVQGIAAQSASGIYGDPRLAAGIIGFANLALGSDVIEVLEAHIAASRDRFRGVRHASVWDASPELTSYKKPPEGLLGDSKFREGVAALGNLGLSYEAWLYHTQLMELVDLAQAFPNVPIVLDHIGGPIGIGPYEDKKDEVMANWKAGITALAACPNVVVKLGGFGMPLGGFGWHERDKPASSTELAQTMGPWYLHCIEEFGVDRCMFESNFPVDKQSVSYTVLWNTFKRTAEGFSADEKAALFRGTALRAYRIGAG
jgi:predicted TIM-barrel fold metal-dependent hydrolase